MEPMDESTPTDDQNTIPTDPSQVPSDSRLWAAAAHLLPIVSLAIIGALVIYLVKKDEDPFVTYHAKQALNFQILWVIAAIVSAFLFIVFIGVILLPIVIIGGLVLSIIAGIKAANGEMYSYPINVQFVK